MTRLNWRLNFLARLKSLVGGCHSFLCSRKWDWNSSSHFDWIVSSVAGWHLFLFFIRYHWFGPCSRSWLYDSIPILSMIFLRRLIFVAEIKLRNKKSSYFLFDVNSWLYWIGANTIEVFGWWLSLISVFRKMSLKFKFPFWLNFVFGCWLAFVFIFYSISLIWPLFTVLILWFNSNIFNDFSAAFDIRGGDKVAK